MSVEMGSLRSLLFVPGSRPELFAKAAAAGADALVLDLEDAVAPAAKDAARTAVTAALVAAPERLTFVRINHPAGGTLERDLAVLAPHAAQAIMVPKVDGPEDIEEIDRLLTAFEQRAGLAPDAIGVMAVVETTLGLRNIFDTLRSARRVRSVGFASAEEGDFLVELGGIWTAEGEALSYARGKLVCDARAAGVVALFDGAFMNLRDEAALERECRLGRIHGFTGKIAIHPRQVAAINRTFSPTQAEIERAQRLLAAFAAAEAQGRGAVQHEGMMVDYANVRRAREILARARALAGREENGSSP